MSANSKPIATAGRNPKSTWARTISPDGPFPDEIHLPDETVRRSNKGKPPQMNVFDMFSQVSSLLTGHQYGLFAVLLVTWLTQLLSQESSFPISMPAGWSSNRWKPLAVLLLHVGLSGLTVVAVQHGTILQALAVAARSAMMTFGAYAVVAKLLWNDNPPAWAKALALIFEPSSSGGPPKSPPPPPSGPSTGLKGAPTALGTLMGLALLLTGCRPANAPILTPQQIARVSAIALEKAWVESVDVCVQIAKTDRSDAVRAKCATAFIPARAQVLAGAGIVDTWGDASQALYACAASDGATAIGQELVLLNSLGARVPPIVSQAVNIAAGLAGQCVRPSSGNIGDPLAIVQALLPLVPTVITAIQDVVQEYQTPSNTPLEPAFAQETEPLMTELDTVISSSGNCPNGAAISYAVMN